MVLGKVLEKAKQPKDEDTEEFVELDESVLDEDNKVGVRIETLKDFLDTERIQQMVRDGNVIFLRIKELRSKDVTELKRSVEKLKKTCVAMNGDIAGVDEDFLILTPKFARVYRGQAV
jgi:SepF-like predicted cell division protein (DUF552 family)